VLFPLSPRTAFTKELLNTVSKGIRILPVDMNDQRRMLRVAIFDYNRYIFELVRLSIRLELIGDPVSQIVQYVNRFLCHDLDFGLGTLCYRKRVEKTWFTESPQLDQLERVLLSTNGLSRTSEIRSGYQLERSGGLSMILANATFSWTWSISTVGSSPG